MIKDKDTIIVRDMYSQKTIYHGFAEYASYKALYSEVMHVEKRNEIYLIIVK